MKDKVDVMLVEKLTHFEEGRGQRNSQEQRTRMKKRCRPARKKNVCFFRGSQRRSEVVGVRLARVGEQAGCCLSSRLINDLVSGPLFSVMMCCCLFRGISPPDRGILG